jgi:hypothetical protein
MRVSRSSLEAIASRELSTVGHVLCRHVAVDPRATNCFAHVGAPGNPGGLPIVDDHMM